MFKEWVGESGSGGGECLGTGQCAETWGGEGTAFLQKGTKPVWLEHWAGEKGNSWSEKTILIADISGVWASLTIYWKLYMISLETCSSILDSGRLEIARSLPVNFRVRNPVLGTVSIGTGSQKEKRFWHQGELGVSSVCRIAGHQGFSLGRILSVSFQFHWVLWIHKSQGE